MKKYLFIFLVSLLSACTFSGSVNMGNGGTHIGLGSGIRF